MNGMTMLTRSQSKMIPAIGALVVLGLVASGCARHPKAIPTWSGDAPATASVPAPVYTQPPVQNYAPPPPIRAEGRFTFTQGCTGSFSVRDARANREIASGRAFNSGRGLIALDRQGRQSRAVGSTTSQSVTFLPDCNCQAGGNQSGNLPNTHQFAARAPSGAMCNAG
jgi:hypothetical protein